MTLRSTPPRHILFQGIQRQDFPDGRCRVTVEVEDREAREIQGVATGTQTLQGSLRAAAHATLEALGEATGGRVEFALVGIKAIRAFDGMVIIASVRLRADERRWTLLGAQAGTEETLLRAAALSILDATNRVLVPYLPEA